MSDRPKFDPAVPCEKCGGEIWGLEYEMTHHQHYDGVSEWVCQKCGRRIGRWTGKELIADDFERRWGGER